MPRSRVRTDQPTITTLEETMAAAQRAAVACFQSAGFTDVKVVLNTVATSLDPDDDVTTWAAGTRITGRCDPMLAISLQQSAEEALHAA
jgi:hypothetical protein